MNTKYFPKFISRSTRTLLKIFPTENCNYFYNLQYDQEGLWSITHPDSAEKFSKILLSFAKKNNVEIKTIVDATAGLGGNTISFCKYFKDVTAIEKNYNRFKILKNNIECYSYKNIKLINENSIEYLKKNNFDLIFFDPPWGGPNYKKNKTFEFTLDGIKLNEIFELINAKIIAFKLPYNYNFESFKNLDRFIIEKIEQKNIVFLIFKLIE